MDCAADAPVVQDTFQLPDKVREARRFAQARAGIQGIPLLYIPLLPHPWTETVLGPRQPALDADRWIGSRWPLGDCLLAGAAIFPTFSTERGTDALLRNSYRRPKFDCYSEQLNVRLARSLARDPARLV